MSKKIQLSKRMSNHVTICCVFRRGVLCLACLLASQVIADFGSSDSRNLSELRNVASQIHSDTYYISGVMEDYDSLSDVGMFNHIIYIGNDSILDSVNATRYYLSHSTAEDYHTQNIYATLYGLIAGFAPGSSPSEDDIPLGVETNGIYWFTRDLSDSLHNTNSVFHRQLTAQETLTNQMERFITLQAQNMTNLIYGISPILSYDDYRDFFTPRYFLDNFAGGHSYQTTDTEYFKYSLPWLFTLFQYQKIPFDIVPSDRSRILQNFTYWFDDANETWGASEYGQTYYDFYGTKWGFDAITNILFSQHFNSTNIFLVKPEVDAMIQDSTEEVQDSLPNTSEELESVPPGDYEEVQDVRIDTSFLDEAKTDATSIKFSETLFDDFKNSYNGIFNFRSSSSLQYSFALQSSDGVNVTVGDTDMLGNASQLLAEKKPTIDALIKIIIGLNKFICLVVLVGKAFKMVSEIFSS